MRNTASRSKSLKSSLESEIARLNREMASFEKIFLSMPLPPDVRKKHSRGKLLIKEAEIDFNKERYVDGNLKITEANEYISGTYNLARATLQEYFKHYGLTQEKLALARPDAIVMHPGPMNRGVEIESSVADGPQSVILEQVTYGIAVRMAVMSILAAN